MKPHHSRQTGAQYAVSGSLTSTAVPARRLDDTVGSFNNVCLLA
jgi:hypothetical protein